MKRLSILLALLLPCAAAQAEVYKCVGPNGHITYTNERPSAKGCNTLSEDQAVTSFPRIRADTSPSPGDFPRVSPDQQKSRDGTRLKILQDELAAEEQSLDGARKAMEAASAGGSGAAADLKAARDKVELHERNVAALKKEMATLR